jgi:small subunit ribosomal protein S15|uniref:Small ribosomal subunit protein uS15 n=1 Tax=candidate division CPR3 bacterium TaxID=2268181 RepID=A0A7V3N4Q6_UNCC3
MKKIDELLSKYRTHKKDSGSAPVQIILLSEEINNLIRHLKKHKHDYDSKLGLLKMVSKRRKFLNYLQKSDKKTYESLIVDLGLRK